MDEETRGYFEEMRRELAGLRGEVKLLTEKVDLNNAALDRLRTEVYRDMNAGFTTMHAAFALSARSRAAAPPA